MSRQRVVLEPEPTNDERLEAVRRGWVELLERTEWEWFCTFTFRGDAVHPERAEKAFQRWVGGVNRQLGGRYWWKKGAGIRWVRALEYQQRGTIHYHALVAGAGGARRLTAKDDWEPNGFARIEAIKDGFKVRDYVSKYVVKGGELEVGGGAVEDGPRRSWPAPVKRWHRSSLMYGARLDAVRAALGPERYAVALECAAAGTVPEQLVSAARERCGELLEV